MFIVVLFKTMTSKDIISNTVNVSYNGTTRPITYVMSPYYFGRCDQSKFATGITMYAFKDLIPNWQKYGNYFLQFQPLTADKGELILPPLEFTFQVETMADGILEIKVNNDKLITLIYTTNIYDEISKQTGFKSYHIDLCDADGNPIERNSCMEYDKNKTTLFALFKKSESIDIPNKLTPGPLAEFTIDEHYDRDTTITFYRNVFNIVKRTPKTVIIEHVMGGNVVDKFQKKIHIGLAGEYIKLGKWRDAMNLKEGLEWNKEYVL